MIKKKGGKKGVLGSLYPGVRIPGVLILTLYALIRQFRRCYVNCRRNVLRDLKKQMRNTAVLNHDFAVIGWGNLGGFMGFVSPICLGLFMYL